MLGLEQPSLPNSEIEIEVEVEARGSRCSAGGVAGVDKNDSEVALSEAAIWAARMAVLPAFWVEQLQAFPLDEVFPLNIESGAAPGPGSALLSFRELFLVAEGCPWAGDRDAK